MSKKKKKKQQREDNEQQAALSNRLHIPVDIFVFFGVITFVFIVLGQITNLFSVTQAVPCFIIGFIIAAAVIEANRRFAEMLRAALYELLGDSVANWQLGLDTNNAVKAFGEKQIEALTVLLEQTRKTEYKVDTSWIDKYTNVASGVEEAEPEEVIGPPKVRRRKPQDPPKMVDARIDDKGRRIIRQSES